MNVLGGILNSAIARDNQISCVGVSVFPYKAHCATTNKATGVVQAHARARIIVIELALACLLTVRWPVAAGSDIKG